MGWGVGGGGVEGDRLVRKAVDARGYLYEMLGKVMDAMLYRATLDF